jgi:hypothetical protein
MNFNCINCGNTCSTWNQSKVHNVCLDCEIKTQKGFPLGPPKTNANQPGQGVAQATHTGGQSGGLTWVGIFLLIAGAIGIYLALGIDTSVPTGIAGQRIMNIGLMADRQILILVSIGTSIVGAIFIGFGRR